MRQKEIDKQKGRQVDRWEEREREKHKQGGKQEPDGDGDGGGMVRV